MSTKPHIVFIAWGFPPSRGSGVYRALFTANFLAEEGFQVTVITTEENIWKRYYGEDKSLIAAIDPRINVVRIPFYWASRETDVRTYGFLRAYQPYVWSRLNYIKERFLYPETVYGPWGKEILNALDEVAIEKPIDLVLSTSNPNISAVAAYRFHKRNKTPYIVDHRDAWTLNVFTGEDAYSKRSKQVRLEKKIFSNASEIWFVNDAIASWHAAKYSDGLNRIHVVANGWDYDLSELNRSTNSDALTIGYIGTISNQVPLEDFLTAWINVLDRFPKYSKNKVEFYGYLGFYNNSNDSRHELLTDAKKHNVSFHGPIEKENLKDAYSRFDACLLLLASGKYVTSGKVYEYISTCLPILAIHDPGNAATQVLREHPATIRAAGMEIEQIELAIIEAFNQVPKIKDSQEANMKAFSTRYSRIEQLKSRVPSIKRIISG
jgi:glycosyltransferase involved in cell wall biosynthesis